MPKIARVLVQHGGEYSLSHEVANRIIGISCRKVLTVTFGAVPIRLIGICQQSLARKSPGENNCAAVEGILRGDFEFLPRLEGLVGMQTRRTPVVRNNTKDSPGLLFGSIG